MPRKACDEVFLNCHFLSRRDNTRMVHTIHVYAYGTDYCTIYAYGAYETPLVYIVSSLRP